MRLLLKQKMFSLLDSYDIYDENGNKAYTVKSDFALSHSMHIYDAMGYEQAYIKQRIFTFLPAFEIYVGDTYLGCIKKELTLFKPKFIVEYKDWYVQGDLFEWDYSIYADNGELVAAISRELNWTDTYYIDVKNINDAIDVLAFVLAMDAEKCSRNN